MAIVCDRCKIENVLTNGDICQKCIDIEEESNVDKSFLEKVYLPQELFERFEELHSQVVAEKPDSKKAFGKFVNTLKTSFINRFTGKEINDPTPQVIIPKERTLDRIQKILNHNLSVYAQQHDMDTPEDLDDWTVADMYSDDWEKTLYQYVDQVVVMDQDDPPKVSDSVPDSAPINVEEENAGQ